MSNLNKSDLEEIVEEKINRERKKIKKEAKKEAKKEIREELVEKVETLEEYSENKEDEKLSRRDFLKKAGLGSAGLAALALTPASANLKITKNGIFDGQDTLLGGSGGASFSQNLDLNSNNIQNVGQLSGNSISVGQLNGADISSSQNAGKGLETDGNGNLTPVATVTDGDGTDRSIWVIANGDSDPSGADPEDIIFEKSA